MCRVLARFGLLDSGAVVSSNGGDGRLGAAVVFCCAEAGCWNLCCLIRFLCSSSKSRSRSACYLCSSSSGGGSSSGSSGAKSRSN